MVAVTALVAMMSPDPVEAGVTRTLPKGNLILGCECWLVLIHLHGVWPRSCRMSAACAFPLLIDLIASSCQWSHWTHVCILDQTARGDCCHCVCEVQLQDLRQNSVTVLIHWLGCLPLVLCLSCYLFLTAATRPPTRAPCISDQSARPSPLLCMGLTLQDAEGCSDKVLHEASTGSRPTSLSSADSPLSRCDAQSHDPSLNFQYSCRPLRWLWIS